MHQLRLSARATSAVRWIFIVGMLAFCIFMTWHTWTVYGLRFQVKDLSLTLETNSQRVRKQQYEYDQVVAALPETQAQLTLVQPNSDAVVQAVDELKNQRKALRTQRDALELELENVQAAASTAQAALAQAQEAQENLAQQVDLLRQEVERLLQEVHTQEE